MIGKDRLLPDVIRDSPSTRTVFDKYGLHGCGGAYGPQETVEFFARVHGVPLDRLLKELEAAKDAPTGEVSYEEELGDILYRRFFRVAIVVVLTAGATLGAGVLFLYGLRETFTSLDLFGLVQAHANAQVYGWVGLFVMGFAFQGFPRFKYVRLQHPHLANGAFLIMASGLALRVGAGLPIPGAFGLGLVGGILEAAAVVLFLWVLGRTLRESQIRDSWDKYVYVGLGCFLLSALLEPVLYVLLSTAPSTEVLIRRVADFMNPYRDLQLLGFAGLMILGVSQRILPAAFGFREPGRVASQGAFLLLTLGLMVDMGGWLVFRGTGQPKWALAAWGGVVLYASGALWLAVALNAFRGGSQDRSRKLIRAAYTWLAVACLMMIVEPAYTEAAGVRFSHAFHGAIRHAFTVGFVSLMILGVSSKVVPILKGIDLRGLSGLWLPFMLINTGNALRVGAQVATDWTPRAFPIMGVSGAFEVLGLALWGAHLWRLMGSWEEKSVARAEKPAVIEPDMKAAEVIDWYPELLEIFVTRGFRELRNPLLRNTLGRRVTLRMACGMKNVDLSDFLEALNGKIR
ncbi:MAG: DUF1858 domain-containing protein [Planctomycetes bacterium]|nr:DUF1858 domain-containing protein [Planctomycetota bacterium]